MRLNKISDIKFIVITGILVIFVMLMTACNEGAAPTSSLNEDNQGTSFAKNGVIHHVSVGGGDVCGGLGLPSGCDANFSLVANMKADGSVSGQWQDTFAGGKEGIHVDIDCMYIVDNGAVIGGVIKNGTLGGQDVTGQRAITAVVDNGTSNNDPADQISFSYTGLDLECGDIEPGAFPLIDLTNGQVKIK